MDSCQLDCTNAQSLLTGGCYR